MLSWEGWFTPAGFNSRLSRMQKYAAILALYVYEAKHFSLEWAIHDLCWKETEPPRRQEPQSTPRKHSIVLVFIRVH